MRNFESIWDIDRIKMIYGHFEINLLKYERLYIILALPTYFEKTTQTRSNEKSICYKLMYKTLESFQITGRITII